MGLAGDVFRRTDGRWAWRLADHTGAVVAESPDAGFVSADEAHAAYDLVRGPLGAPRDGSTHLLMTSWFLGPKAENADIWRETLDHIFTDYLSWRRNYFPSDPLAIPRSMRHYQSEWVDDFNDHLDVALSRLKAHFPFYSPRYIAHMLSETSLPAVAGYFAGMLYNPNNVTSEAAPVTVQWELEVGRLISEMLGYDPDRAWGHLASGGTLANLEALWVARQIQFAPLALKEVCGDEGITEFAVRRPDGTSTPLVEVNDRDLLAIETSEAIAMPRTLARHLVGTGRSPKDAVDLVNRGLARSTWNPASVGLGPILGRLGMRPAILVSEAAHYSIAKAANVLGYGSDSIIPVAVDGRFRLDPAALRSALGSLRDDRYVAAVVAIIGTTEEGAIDPMDEIVAIRREQHLEHNRSFWLHADAAWGGYFASLLRGLDLPGSADPAGYAAAMNIDEVVVVDTALPLFDGSDPHRFVGTTDSTTAVRVGWDEDLVARLLALGEADSITVDPHKMGYVPYPAGVVCYRDRAVTEHVTQRALYLSDSPGGIGEVGDAPLPDAVGPFIIEGSKPGAAALATWLAHKTIPLVRQGHGKLIKTSILNARKLHCYLGYHREFFWRLVPTGIPADGFTFVPLCEPDTNIVCFVAVPRALVGGALAPMDCSLERLNRFNREIYGRLSVPVSERGTVYPYGQEFFASRTTLTAEQYHWGAVNEWLQALQIGPVTEAEYREHGVFVLRSTVMNPFYYPAEKPASTRTARDYLMEFVEHLHEVTSDVLVSMGGRV